MALAILENASSTIFIDSIAPRSLWPLDKTFTLILVAGNLCAIFWRQMQAFFRTMAWSSVSISLDT